MRERNSAVQYRASFSWRHSSMNNKRMAAVRAILSVSQRHTHSASSNSPANTWFFLPKRSRISTRGTRSRNTRSRLQTNTHIPPEIDPVAVQRLRPLTLGFLGRRRGRWGGSARGGRSSGGRPPRGSRGRGRGGGRRRGPSRLGRRKLGAPTAGNNRRQHHATPHTPPPTMRTAVVD